MFQFVEFAESGEALDADAGDTAFFDRIVTSDAGGQIASLEDLAKFATRSATRTTMRRTHGSCRSTNRMVSTRCGDCGRLICTGGKCCATGTGSRW